MASIQELVGLVAEDFLYECGGFHINWVRVDIYKRFGIAYSYKQVRNALYRLAVGGGLWSQCGHMGYGLYAWVTGVVKRVCRVISLSRPRMIGGIYFRRLGLVV